MKEKCSDCIYRHEEFRNTGYGMPVQVKESCILENQGKPCQFIPNEKKGTDKLQHIMRSIYNNPNHRKSRKVRKILEAEIDKQIALTGSLK